MKKLFTIFAAILLTASVFAQSPEKISYQAVVRDGSNNLVTSHAVGMQISILQGSASGTAVYIETQTPTTNANGLISVEIGVEAGFSSIDWSAGPYFIKTETDPTGGTSYTIMGTSQLLSVPYSLHAKTAEHVALAVSATGDTLFVGSEKWVIVPGISEANPQSGTTVTDIEGNVYQTVVIGTQEWMAENLKTTKLNNGTSIPLVIDNTEWSNLNSPAYCWYDNNQDLYGDIYGPLYNWYTIETGNLCPTGWHASTDDEWTTLTDYLGGENVASSKLKEAGSTHWHSPNTGNNETGFTALPGGHRGTNGVFNGIKSLGIWWSSTEVSTGTAWFRLMFNSDDIVVRDIEDKYFGFSVRCIRN